MSINVYLWCWKIFRHFFQMNCLQLIASFINHRASINTFFWHPSKKDKNEISFVTTHCLYTKQWCIIYTLRWRGNDLVFVTHVGIINRSTHIQTAHLLIFPNRDTFQKLLERYSYEEKTSFFRSSILNAFVGWVAIRAVSCSSHLSKFKLSNTVYILLGFSGTNKTSVLRYLWNVVFSSNEYKSLRLH